MSLKITFRAGRNEFRKIRGVAPSAVMRGGVCEVKIEGEQPAEVAERARVLLDKLRSIA